MKILITGGEGLVGNSLIEIGKGFNLVATYYAPPSEKKCRFLQLDITDKNKVLDIIEKEKPNIVIHCAAMTDVDAAEENKDIAWKINVEGTKNIAEACERKRSKMVFLSTDYIFDGKNGPYSESDKPNPINYYAKTKYEAEKIVKQLKDFLIIRSTVIYGPKRIGHNFATWLIDKLEKGESVKIVTDQYSNPTFSYDLADKIFKLIKMKQKGIFNVVGKDYVNRYEFSIKIADAFMLNKNLIKPITTKELDIKAKRPLKGGLKTEKIEKLNLKTLSIEESLEWMKKEMKKYEQSK